MTRFRAKSLASKVELVCRRAARSFMRLSNTWPVVCSSRPRVSLASRLTTSCVSPRVARRTAMISAENATNIFVRRPLSFHHLTSSPCGVDSGSMHRATRPGRRKRQCERDLSDLLRHLYRLRGIFRFQLAERVPGRHGVSACRQVPEDESPVSIRNCEIGRRQNEDDAGHPVMDVTPELDDADFVKQHRRGILPLV